MADIELVIKIPKETVNEIRNNAMFAGSISSDIRWDVTSAIVNGTPLPKGHGRIGDLDALKKDDEVTEWISLNAVRTGKMLKKFSELFIKKIDAAQTIIPAESEGECNGK